MNAVVNFDIGERRHVMLLVHSCKDEDFEILDASYRLLKSSGELEDEGACVINEHVIDLVIQPETSGSYRLQVTYHIADETLIENIIVKVGR